MNTITVGKGMSWESEIDIGAVVDVGFISIIGALGFLSIRSGAGYTSIYVTRQELKDLASMFAQAASELDVQPQKVAA